MQHWIRNERVSEMKIEQFVIAYRVEQDRIRAMLPDSFESLRPVFRINTEIRGEDPEVYIEFNTPVSGLGKRGWLNIGNWTSEKTAISLKKDEAGVFINTDFLHLNYRGVGILGGCPSEKDNDGCFYTKENGLLFVPSESVSEKKEFCDCSFEWTFSDGNSSGKSEGKTIPALFEEKGRTYPKIDLIPENAAAVPCLQVLGSYIVRFERL